MKLWLFTRLWILCLVWLDALLFEEDCLCDTKADILADFINSPMWIVWFWTFGLSFMYFARVSFQYDCFLPRFLGILNWVLLEEDILDKSIKLLISKCFCAFWVIAPELVYFDFKLRSLPNGVLVLNSEGVWAELSSPTICVPFLLCEKSCSCMEWSLLALDTLLE